MTSKIVQRRLRITGGGIERTLQIVKSRERRRTVLEDAGIQPAEVPLHFVFDFIQRSSQDHSHIMLMVIAAVGQRDARRIRAGDDKNVGIHEQIESPVKE